MTQAGVTTPVTDRPLPAEDVALLREGDVLRCVKGSDEAPAIATGEVVTFIRPSGSGGISKCIVTSADEAFGYRPGRFTFLGRPDADGWIEWAGGESPSGTTEVRFEDGFTLAYTAGDPIPAEALSHGKITHYRLSRPPSVSADPVGGVTSGAGEFQARCGDWLTECFGAHGLHDVPHRNRRFLEEAGELVQASGMPEDEAQSVIRYVYSRLPGQPNQEVGGVMMTLAAHCIATGFDMNEEGERELARVWTKVDVIRAKEAAKPSFSALAPSPPVQPSERERALEALAKYLCHDDDCQLVLQAGPIPPRRCTCGLERARERAALTRTTGEG